MKRIAAVDVGHGNVKFNLAMLPPGDVVFDSFPSLAPQVTTRNLTKESFAKRDTVIVSVDGKDYEVGRDAALAQSGFSFDRTLDADFSRTPAHLALLKGAMHYMGVTDIDVLILGLPNNTYVSHKEDLISRVVGRHDVTSDKVVTVRDCKVIPQALGGFYYYGQESGRLREMVRNEETTLVVDPGFRTLDWMVCVGNKPVDARSGALKDGGAASMLVMLKEKIEADAGQEIGNLVKLDKAWREDKPFRLYGEEIQLDKYRDMVETIAADRFNQIVHAIGGAGDIDNVVVVGGPAKVFGRAIMKKLPKQRVWFADTDNHFANAKGFYMMGAEWAKRSA